MNNYELPWYLDMCIQKFELGLNCQIALLEYKMHMQMIQLYDLASEGLGLTKTP